MYSTRGRTGLGPEEEEAEALKGFAHSVGRALGSVDKVAQGGTRAKAGDGAC